MVEIWKDIEGYNGRYQISNCGNVKSVFYKKSILKNEKILKPRIGFRNKKNRYAYVVLSQNSKVKTFYIHRLVAIYFVDNKDNKPYVNHIDGNKENNHFTNLEWVTPLENNLHSIQILNKKAGLGFKYDKSKKSKKVKQIFVSEEGYEYHLATYANSVIASKITNINQRSINACCNNKYTNAGGFIWRYE